MRRREFITLLGGAVAWPLAAHAQQTAKLPTIGLVGGAIPSTQGTWIAAFVSECASLAGSRTEPSQSRFAGRRDATNATAKSLQSSSDSRSMSLSPSEPQPQLRQSTSHQ